MSKPVAITVEITVNGMGPAWATVVVVKDRDHLHIDVPVRAVFERAPESDPVVQRAKPASR